MMDGLRIRDAVQPNLQALSWEIWDRKYRLRTLDGAPIDITPDDTLVRVARAIAQVESEPIRQEWETQFLWALRNGAIPAGRILTNLGAEVTHPLGTQRASTINCVVSKRLHDDFPSILDAIRDAGLTLKAGCGIGYDFSTIRPEGALVRGNKTGACGPLAIMDILDRLCQSISTAGKRRGAQMAVMDIRHPDIFKFIEAKRTKGRLQNFNLSVLVPDAFFDALHKEADWPLIFPLDPARLGEVDKDRITWQSYPDTGNCVHNENGHVACEIIQTVQASELWDKIMQSTYTFSEPGVLFVDRINNNNNNWYCETIRATNPCGEQPLPPSGACLLGSINLTRFVTRPFTPSASFNWDRYEKVVSIFVRLLDNVVDLNELPLDEQRDEILRKRRHGMGVLGLGSAIAMLGMKYGDARSCAFTEDVMKSMALVGWRQAVALAREKGPAPIMDEPIILQSYHLARCPELAQRGLAIGQKITGKELFAIDEGYMSRIAAACPSLLDEIREHGARFTHHTSIAPTGTIALSFGNNASSGIEPSFRHTYTRNVLADDMCTQAAHPVESFEFRAFQKVTGHGISPETLPDHFVTTNSIPFESHLAIQAAAQKWVDSSISKTINVAEDTSYDAFRQIYLDAAALGVNGCTTFRENSDVYDSVLQDASLPKDKENELTSDGGATTYMPLDAMTDNQDAAASLNKLGQCDCGTSDISMAGGCRTCLNCGTSRCEI